MAGQGVIEQAEPDAIGQAEAGQPVVEEQVVGVVVGGEGSAETGPAADPDNLGQPSEVIEAGVGQGQPAVGQSQGRRQPAAVPGQNELGQGAAGEQIERQAEGGEQHPPAEAGWAAVQHQREQIGVAVVLFQQRFKFGR